VSVSRYHRGRGGLGGLHELDSTDHPAHAGALGGNATGNFSKNINLGPLGNTITGALGGGIGGQILNAILGLGGTAAASGLDIGSIVSAFATGDPGLYIAPRGY
jgi:hypothetical protein